MTVEKLFEGDMRLGNLCDAILDMLYERGDGIPFPAILGCLEIVKAKLIETQNEKLL